MMNEEEERAWEEHQRLVIQAEERERFLAAGIWIALISMFLIVMIEVFW